MRMFKEVRFNCMLKCNGNTTAPAEWAYCSVQTESDG
jgi:hypothetical protein